MEQVIFRMDFILFILWVVGRGYLHYFGFVIQIFIIKNFMYGCYLYLILRNDRVCKLFITTQDMLYFSVQFGTVSYDQLVFDKSPNF
jgi:hypothetical protein